MRPITGTATGRLLSSSAPPELRTRPSVPSMTLGVKPRRPLPLPDNSGSLITSIARARLGRRRMKPRSSRAVINRWMPDLERRSSASFISSNDGGTPDSFRRSLINRRSSYCLRVSISTNPQFDKCHVISETDLGAPGTTDRGHSLKSQNPSHKRKSKTKLTRPNPKSHAGQTAVLETNHEHTLYVPYVFRSHLISGQRGGVCSIATSRRSGRQPQDVTRRAGGRFGRKGGADQKRPCRSEIRHQGAVLMIDRKSG